VSEKPREVILNVNKMIETQKTVFFPFNAPEIKRTATEISGQKILNITAPRQSFI